MAALLVLIPVLLRSDGFSTILKADPDLIREQSRGSTTLLLLITLLLMTVQNLFTVIPLFLLVTLNVTLFDLTGGYLWSWFTSMVGAAVSFFMIRYWFQEFFNRFVNEAVRRKLEDSSFSMVLLGRILPLPSSVVNIAAGLSSVGIKSYLYATALGNMIYILILSLLSQGILSLRLERWAYAAAAGVLIVLAILRLWRRRRKNKHEPDEHHAVGL